VKLCRRQPCGCEKKAEHFKGDAKSARGEDGKQQKRRKVRKKISRTKLVGGESLISNRVFVQNGRGAEQRA